jgi:KDO2-lipid IV(A) lauroyltransferase
VRKNRLAVWAEYLPAAALVPLVRRLPPRAGAAAARGLGDLAFALTPNYRRIAEVNLRLAFKGAMPPDRVRAIVRGAFRNFARTAFELIHATGLSREQVLRLTDCPDDPAFVATLLEGRGVVAGAAHFSNWYWPALYCAARGGKVNAIVRPLDNPRLNEAMNAALARWGIAPIPRAEAAEAGAAALRRGEILALMVDQNAAAGGRFVPFFGVPASTMRGVHAFRQATGCHVVVTHHRRLDNGRHQVRVSSPLDWPADEDAALAGVNARVEDIVRLDPSAYFWLHPRWKKRPPGLPTFYEGLKV